ncbi:MAG: hypothetical protein RMK78_06490 [Thermaurantiacus sp.]|nr:hypothetical protein [Thermaurantiacus sp.]
MILQLMAAWRAMAIASACGLLAGSLYLSIATRWYSATAVLGPKTGGIVTPRLTGLSNVGGLASILGGVAPDDLRRADIYWRSNRFAASFLRNEELVKDLLPERWDEEAGTWRPDRGISARLGRLFGLVGADARPTLDDIREALDEKFVIDIKEQSFREISFLTERPQRSIRLLQWTIEETNRAFREDQLREISETLAFLDTRTTEEEQPRTLEALASFVEFLEQQQLRLEATPVFMFDIIQPPTPLSRPARPDPLLVLVAAALLPPTAVGVAVVLFPGVVGRTHLKLRRPSGEPS